MNITTNGIDLAKKRFSLHGTDVQSKAVLKKTVSRSKLLAQLANFLHCVVGMEACSGARHWVPGTTKIGARCLHHRIIASSHHRIIASRFVALYRRKSKNDNNDAEVTLRNSFVSHLLQSNVDIRTIQKLLSHSI